MKTIELQPVKRCPKCQRLIPQHLNTCPYCEGHYTIPRPEPDDDETTRIITPPRQPMSPKTKKRIIFGVGAAAALGLIIFGVVYLMSALRLNRSILEPFSADEIASIAQDHPDFRDQYQLIETMRDVIKDEGRETEYEDVTYKDMIAYLDKCADEQWCSDIIEKAQEEYEEKFHQPLLSKVKAEEKKWRDYIEEHDPNKYLVITPHERYVDDDWCWRPGFYYELSFPKGSIRDCSAHCGLVSKTTGDWHSNAEEWSDLADLRDRNVNESYRWSNVSSYTQDIYDNYSMYAELYSVTLNNGTVISTDDIDNVPQAARQYIDNPKAPNAEARFIRECIDKDYPFPDEYIGKALDKALKDLNPLCHRLVKYVSKHDHNFSVPMGTKVRLLNSGDDTDDDSDDTLYDSAVCDTAYWE